MFHYHGRAEFASSPPLGGGSDTNSNISCTLIQNLPCRTSYRLFIYKLFYGPLAPPLVKWTWMVSTFSTNESSYIAMVMSLQSYVWSGLKWWTIATLICCMCIFTNTLHVYKAKIISTFLCGFEQNMPKRLSQQLNIVQSSSSQLCC